MTRRLLAAVSIKALLEIIFVCVVVSIAAVRTFHPSLRGAIDMTEATRIAGWAYDSGAIGAPLDVQLFIDGGFVAAARADAFRPDLVEAGATPLPDHGFSFSLESTNLARGPHTAQVYAVRAALGGTLTLIPISKEVVSFEVP